MRKVFAISVCVVLTLSGCGTYAGQGAHTGAGFGSILGSAIGGISGGHRGSNIGTIVGMAGGAVVGAAVGSAADKSKQKQLEQYQQPYNTDNARVMDDSGFDPDHRGDDRIVFEESPVDNHSQKYNHGAMIEIRNVSFTDKDGNGVIQSGEECQVSFEIMNCSSKPINDITPMVTETTGNKRIYISPSVRVERILPGRGIRYTATVMGGKKLKDGNVVIKLSVAQGTKELESPIQELEIETRKN